MYLVDLIEYTICLKVSWTQRAKMIQEQINKQEKEKDDTQPPKIEKGLQNDLINCNNHMHVWYPSTAALMLGDKLIQNILLGSSPSQ
jgi:hypothetical protein